jgi:hypothetical protein
MIAGYPREAKGLGKIGESSDFRTARHSSLLGCFQIVDCFTHCTRCLRHLPLLRSDEELELVPVRVLEEDLLGAVGTPGGAEFDALPFQEFGGFADVIDAHGEMASPGALIDRGGEASADEMELLVAANSEPSAGKIECRSMEGGKTNRFAVEACADFNRGNEKGHVVQLSDLHAEFCHQIKEV